MAPSLRLRTEGLMEAAVLTGACDSEQLDKLQAECYRAAFGEDIDVHFGSDWRAFYPFPQIPAVGHRAPVYPSTKE